VIAGWGWAVWRRRSDLILAGAIYFAGFATTANILISTGTIMGERLAYLPSAGFCLLIAILWSRIETRHRYAAMSLLALVVVALGTRTIVRNRNWKDNYALYQAAVRVVPGSAKAHAYLGNEYLNRRQFDLARSEFQIALTIYPDFPDALDSMALVAFRTGNDSEAVRLMESALQMSDRRDINYDYMVVNLAAMLMQLGRGNDALRLLDREIAESPEYSRAWSNRAVIHYQRGESAIARSDAEAALRLDPNNSQALGVLNKTSPMLPRTSAQ
jgi:protein O-mannosyl-transferase